MSSSDPQLPRVRREGLRVAWIVLFCALSLIPIAVWNSVREPGSASEVVEQFLRAVREGDLERAYALTDTGIPLGEEAAFLHPDAVSDDWEVLRVREREGDYSSETIVTVVIGHDGGTANGAFTVDNYDGYAIKDPYAYVQFHPSSNLAVQINDRVIETTPSARGWNMYQASPRYALFPGVYEFHEGEERTEPVAVFPGDATEEPLPLPPPDPTPEQVAAVQSSINDLIDSCLEYRVPAPPGCPFATDGEIDSEDRQRLTAPEDLTWSEVEYPRVTLVADSYRVEDWGEAAKGMLSVEFTDPGRLVLEGTGSPGRDRRIEFTTVCHFAAVGLVPLLSADGSAELVWDGSEVGDSCRGSES